MMFSQQLARLARLITLTHTRVYFGKIPHTSHCFFIFWKVSVFKVAMQFGVSCCSATPLWLHQLVDFVHSWARRHIFLFFDLIIRFALLSFNSGIPKTLTILAYFPVSRFMNWATVFHFRIRFPTLSHPLCSTFPNYLHVFLATLSFDFNLGA